MSRIRRCVGDRSGHSSTGAIAGAMLAAAAVAASAGRSAADWVDTFPGGVPQQTWLTDSLPGFSQYTQTFFPGGQQLASNLEVFDGGAQIAYAYVNEFFDGSLGVRVRSVINPSPQVPEMTHTGVLAYLNPFVSSAYAVGVTWTSPAAGAPQRVIEINKSSFGGISFQGGRAIPGFNPNLSYIIEAEVSPINELGNQVVTARLYDMQETLVVEYADVLRQNFDPDDPTAASPLSSGRSGVFAWRSDSGSTATLLGRWGTTSSSLPSPDLVWGGNTNLTIPHNDGIIPQGGSGTWQSSQANWLYAGAPTYWNSARKAIFRGTPGTVTVAAAGATASGGLDFGGNGFVIQGGPVTLGGSAGNAISVASGVSARIESPLAGAAGLQKVGAGTLVLAGTSTLSGASSVQAGRLTVNGSLAGTQLAVSGGVLDGTGNVGGLTVTGGGTVSPGASPGTLTVTGNATLAGGGNYNWQVYNAAGTAGSTTGWDLLSVGGALDIAATSASRFNLNLWSLSGVSPDVNGPAINFNSSQNGSWKIASAAGGITGFAADKFTINTAAINNTAGFTNDLAGGSFAVVQDGNDLVLQFTAAGGPTPEPVRITGVYVKGSGWNAGYLARSPFSNVQGATVGWELPDGAAQLASASNVAWNNVDTITVQFDQPIAQPDAAALQLVRGTTSGNQTIVPTLAPTLLGDGSVAQWTLPAGFAELQRGKYVISIAADGITNADGTTILDGDWITGVSTFAQGSGDGEAGGTFNFFFNSLVGDVNADGVMNAGDLSAIRNALTSPLNTPLAADSSNYRLDIDGLNSLNSADLSKTRNQLSSALGTQLASLPAVTAPTAGGNLDIAAVPEPGLGLAGLVAVAAAGLALRRRAAA